MTIASITIRNLDDRLKRKLRLRAAGRNRSMEDEAREILRTALAEEAKPPRNLADAIRRRVKELGGFDFDLPPRGPMREPPDFE
jgi:plasmid stability protein